MILFGAGVYAKKYKALLEYLHMDFDYFTDNDSSKWNTTVSVADISAPPRYPNTALPPERMVLHSVVDPACLMPLAFSS